MFLPQEFIHRLEQGAFSRVIQFVALGLLIAGIALAFDLRAFRNLATEEGMDAAQLARNLAAGRGYVTYNISPLSIHLLKEKQAERIAAKQAAKVAIAPQDFMDQARLRNNHPDLANPPLYPYLLSLYLRAVAPDYAISREKSFERFRPDLMIALFNQALLALAACLVFVLARRLFDPLVAWTSMFIFVGSGLFWRISASGQSTILLLLIFLALLWALARLEQGIHIDNWTGGKPLLFGATIGLLVGLGFLTRYAFGWVMIPVVLFLILHAGARRFAITASALLVFVLVITPWIQRNLQVAGAPFGTAGYSVFQLTDKFPADEIPRSIELDLRPFAFQDYVRKFKNNVPEILQKELPTLGGTWLTAFFFVGLMVVFRSASLNRFRGFILAVMALFVVVQALGKTHLSVDSPIINTENLLVLLAPAVIIFGVSLFFTLLDQWNVPEFGFRVVLTTMFGVLVSLPLVFTLVSRTHPVAYPPYFPPVIQITSSWLRESEQMMSDIPWAVAWYGDRQCVLWTRNPAEDFYQLHDFDKPLNALYLSPRALDSRFLSGLLKGPGAKWGRPFLVDVMAKQDIPKEFPLKYAPPQGFWPENPDPRYFNPKAEKPEQLFLSDRIRWP